MVCRTMLAVACLLATGSQAYAPIQMVSGRGKGLVVLPQGFLANIRGALTPHKLFVRNPASDDSPSSLPYFTARLDQTITWDVMGWCLEASGNKHGDAVRVNSCSGARTQKWNWIPDGRGHNMIKLRDTELCLHAIDKEVGPNGAPIELRGCGNEVAQWQFEEPLPLPRISQGDDVPYDARYVMIVVLTLAGLGAVSLGARIWQVRATGHRDQESVCTVMALDPMHPSRVAQAHASRTSKISMAESKVSPLALTRRQGLAAAALTLPSTVLSPGPVTAAEKGGVQWVLDLPTKFAIQRQLASITRVRTETMLQADDPATGAIVKLLLVPFGQQAAANLSPDDQLALATYVYNGKGSADAIAKAMTASAARSRGVVKLTPQGAASGYTADDGRRYVRYQYTTQRCAGELDGGKCAGDAGRLDSAGELSSRRTLATLTMSPVSQYRTNTERERMKEMGQTRNVDVLWLLTLSAPDGAAWAAIEPEFERLSKTLRIPTAPGERVESDALSL